MAGDLHALPPRQAAVDLRPQLPDAGFERAHLGRIGPDDRANLVELELELSDGFLEVEQNGGRHRHRRRVGAQGTGWRGDGGFVSWGVVSW